MSKRAITVMLLVALAGGQTFAIGCLNPAEILRNVAINAFGVSVLDVVTSPLTGDPIGDNALFGGLLGGGNDDDQEGGFSLFGNGGGDETGGASDADL